MRFSSCIFILDKNICLELFTTCYADVKQISAKGKTQIDCSLCKFPSNAISNCVLPFADSHTPTDASTSSED